MEKIKFSIFSFFEKNAKNLHFRNFKICVSVVIMVFIRAKFLSPRNKYIYIYSKFLTNFFWSRVLQALYTLHQTLKNTLCISSVWRGRNEHVNRARYYKGRIEQRGSRIECLDRAIYWTIAEKMFIVFMIEK